LVEPLLHFAVPFTSVRATGLDWRKALFASLVALTPDLDVFFNVHRSESHSLILLTIVVVPLLILLRKHKTLRTLVLLGTLGILTHFVLDLFQNPVPLLWPLLNQSLSISTILDLHIGSAPTVTGSVDVQIAQEPIEPFSHFDAPLVTAEGFCISVLLLLPSILLILKGYRPRGLGSSVA
jgi:hypothetical protein